MDIQTVVAAVIFAAARILLIGMMKCTDILRNFHLLPDPGKALAELWRVVKPGGKIVIPTYINMSKESAGLAVKFVELLGNPVLKLP